MPSVEFDRSGLKSFLISASRLSSNDSQIAPGFVNDWSPPNSPYIQMPEKMEPPIRIEPTTYGLPNPRCTQCFQQARVAVDQSCPFERIEQLIEELEKLIHRGPKCSKRPSGR